MRKLSISVLAVLPLLLTGAAVVKAQEQNPVKSSLAVIEEAGRFYRYDCEMCHGADGSGKGDLAQDMKLETHDWRTGNVIEKMTDAEIFTIITKGKGKMVPEGERVKAEIRWSLVHYVRLLARKGGGGSTPPAPAIGKPAAEEAKPAAETPKPAAEAPKPAVEAPKPPAAEPPKPPAADAPKPAGDAPKPPADAPTPPADAPKPPARQGT
ncbi:MAG: c-type cytochrome [Acidobacteriia bacterium]|nr:c-type cytochrome [Terriglobia bacterium]